MKRKVWLSLVALIVVTVPLLALAQGLVPCTGAVGDECQFCRLVQLIDNVVTWLVGVLSVIAAIMIAYGGFLLVTSTGNTGQKEKAKTLVTNTIIGFVIVLAAWLLIDLFMQILVGGQVNGQIWNQVQCVAQPTAQIVHTPLYTTVALAPQTCDPTPGATTNSCASVAAQCTAIAGCTARTNQTSATQGSVTCDCQTTSTAGGACDTTQMTTINFLTGSVTVHNSMVSKLQAIDARWRSLGGNSYYPVTSIGSYNCRQVTGGSGYSMHAYGYAIDINPGPNGYVKPKPAGGCPTNMTSQNPPFYTLFTSQGFGWGGNWSSLCDAMHFSAAAREGGWIP